MILGGFKKVQKSRMQKLLASFSVLLPLSYFPLYLILVRRRKLEYVFIVKFSRVMIVIISRKNQYVACRACIHVSLLYFQLYRTRCIIIQRNLNQPKRKKVTLKIDGMEDTKEKSRREVIALRKKSFFDIGFAMKDLAALSTNPIGMRKTESKFFFCNKYVVREPVWKKYSNVNNKVTNGIILCITSKTFIYSCLPTYSFVIRITFSPSDDDGGQRESQSKRKQSGLQKSDIIALNCMRIEVDQE